MVKEKSFFLLCLVLMAELTGLLLLRKRYTLLNRHKPIPLSEEEKMMVFMDVANDLGLQ